MLSTRKHTERWQRLINGYGGYWYFKSFVRWVSLITAAVNLIVFGAVWRDYAQYYYGENAQIGIWAFAIACVSFYLSSLARKFQLTITPAFVLSHCACVCYRLAFQDAQKLKLQSWPSFSWRHYGCLVPGR